MALGNTSAFLITYFLVLFIVTMVGVYDIVELAQLALEMGGLDLDIVERRLW